MLYFFLQIFLKPPSTIKYCPRKNYIFICFFFKLFKNPHPPKNCIFSQIFFYLDGALPPGDGHVGGVGPLLLPDLVLVVEDLHQDQPQTPDDPRPHLQVKMTVFSSAVQWCEWLIE